MSELAERLYRTKKQNSQETTEQKMSRLIDKRNTVSKAIYNAKDYNSLIDINMQLKELEQEGYTDTCDLILIKKDFREKVNELQNECETEREKLILKQCSLKKERYLEDAKILEKLSTQADNILLQILMQLGTDKTKNKLIVSEMFNGINDRASALALMKLSIHVVYGSLISPTMKERLLVASKSKEEIEWQESQNRAIEEVGKKLSKVTINNFMLNRLKEQVFQKESDFFN